MSTQVATIEAGSQGGLQLSVKAFHHAIRIRTGVIYSCTAMPGAENQIKASKQRGLKLAFTVCFYGARTTKARYPCINESAGNRLSGDVMNGNSLRPVWEMVNHGEYITVTVRHW